MAKFWEKVKHRLDQGAKSIKEGTEAAVKTVSEKAPKIATDIAEKSKEIATTVSEKTQEVVTSGQLKLKHHNLSRDVSKHFTELGEQVFELKQKNEKNIFQNADVKNQLSEIKGLEDQISNIEKEMDQLKSSENIEPQTNVSPVEDDEKSKSTKQ